MADVQLPTPVFDVFLDDGDGNATTYRVQIVNADLVRYDRTAAKHGWPQLGAAPSLWNTFVCWSAMRRTGTIPTDYKFELFEERALAIWPKSAGGVVIGADLEGVSLNGHVDEVDEVANPTQPDREAV